jgi:hypothetical protein
MGSGPARTPKALLHDRKPEASFFLSGLFDPLKFPFKIFIENQQVTMVRRKIMILSLEMSLLSSYLCRPLN